jgi:hypothetical protein
MEEAPLGASGDQLDAELMLGQHREVRLSTGSAVALQQPH